MAETANISEIASRIAKDIFRHFLWNVHPKRDDNFECVTPTHLGGKQEKAKKITHPGDVVFHYDDPYLGKRIYLHTDLKSYAAQSITKTQVRDAFKSLGMTVECAKNSEEWRTKYSVDASEVHEVRGLLFVHNHDGKYQGSFQDVVEKANLQSLSLAPEIVLHFLGPLDIQRLYDIGNDIVRLLHEKQLPADYSFYYPDLVGWHREGDVWGQAATIEGLTGPYTIIKYGRDSTSKGYIVYYNRKGESTEEFAYFLDSLSHYQMLESGQDIRIRATHKDVSGDIKSIFQTAKKKYAKAWGFDPAREAILSNIEIDPITSLSNNYSPGAIGWRK